jgi:hypothetical protein
MALAKCRNYTTVTNSANWHTVKSSKVHNRNSQGIHQYKKKKSKLEPKCDELSQGTSN